MSVVRLRSDDRREALLVAATGIIVAHGLAASTASLAKADTVVNGSLFTAFRFKAELPNCCYVELKTKMALAGVESVADRNCIGDQMHHVWMRWLEWGTTLPEKRRARARIGVLDCPACVSR